MIGFSEFSCRYSDKVLKKENGLKNLNTLSAMKLLFEMHILSDPYVVTYM